MRQRALQIMHICRSIAGGRCSRPGASRHGRTSCPPQLSRHILRASQLPLLGADKKYVSSDLRKAASGRALSPILLVRGDGNHPLIIAYGYHRVCASYWVDENTDIPCVLV